MLKHETDNPAGQAGDANRQLAMAGSGGMAVSSDVSTEHVTADKWISTAGSAQLDQHITKPNRLMQFKQRFSTFIVFSVARRSNGQVAHDTKR